MFLTTAISAAADDQPPIWPTVRYGGPDRLAFGVAVQPNIGRVFDGLIVVGTWGTGAMKAGVGLGGFGGSLMGGSAILATVARTRGSANSAQTFVGMEAELMAFNVSVRAGPSVRVTSGRGPRVRLSWSVGWGF
jgi:hypothetical protein